MATLGKTVKGASQVENGWSPSFILTKVVAQEYGKITQISAHLYWGAAGKSAKGVVVSHDALNDRPLAKLDEGVSVPVTPYQFNDFTGLSYVMATGEVLWIGVYCEGNPYSSGDIVAGHKTMVWKQGDAYPTVPEVYAPIFTPYVTDLEAAIYAIYTPTDEPPPPPVTTHILTVDSTPIQGIPFTIEKVT